MTLIVYGHPLSPNYQKVAIALREKDLSFTLHQIDMEEAGDVAELENLWPLRQFPVLLDARRTVAGTSTIIEYLDLCHPDTARMVPVYPQAAFEARSMDRFLDDHVMQAQHKIVFDLKRDAADRDELGVRDTREELIRAYRWLEDILAERRWAAGDTFTIADCTAGPALFYAHWVSAIPDSCVKLRSYRERLKARPSISRAIDEARPFRAMLPVGPRGDE